MSDTRTKDQPVKRLPSLLKRAKPSLNTSKDAGHPLKRRTVRFSESVARFNYVDLDASSSDQATGTANWSIAERPELEAPADAIIFGDCSSLGIKSARHATAASPSSAPKKESENPKKESERPKRTVSASGLRPLRDLFVLQRRTKQLLETFVLTDTRANESPVYAMSADLLPQPPLGESELLFFEDDCGPQNAGVTSIIEDGRLKRLLTVKRPMYDWSSKEPTYEAFTQCVITKLTQDAGIQDPDEDVWLTIASQEMSKLLARDGRIAQWIPDIPESWPKYLVQGLEALLAFHELFLILKHPADETTGLEMRHVSERFLEMEKGFLTSLEHQFRADTFRIKRLMERKERFFFDARWSSKTRQQLVCCVPLFEPRLRTKTASWICFLISGPVFERSAGFV